MATNSNFIWVPDQRWFFSILEQYVTSYSVYRSRDDYVYRANCVFACSHNEPNLKILRVVKCPSYYFSGSTSHATLRLLFPNMKVTPKTGVDLVEFSSEDDLATFDLLLDKYGVQIDKYGVQIAD